MSKGSFPNVQRRSRGSATLPCQLPATNPRASSHTENLPVSIRFQERKQGDSRGPCHQLPYYVARDFDSGPNFGLVTQKNQGPNADEQRNRASEPNPWRSDRGNILPSRFQIN